MTTPVPTTGNRHGPSHRYCPRWVRFDRTIERRYSATLVGRIDEWFWIHRPWNLATYLQTNVPLELR